MPYEQLAVNRVNAIMSALVETIDVPDNLPFLKRTPIINATDGEIIAKFTGNVVIADVVADDQKALVRNNGSFALESTKIPNIKHGAPITQELLNLLDRINAGGGIRDDEGIVTNYLNRTLANLLLGVRQRMEQFLIGAALGRIDYDRNGIIFTALYPIPADLNITVGVTWATSATATPIADTQRAVREGKERGKNYNRMTLTSDAWDDMVATTEFRNKASLYSQLVLPNAASFPVEDMVKMTDIAGRILGMTIELNDYQYKLPQDDGTNDSVQYLVDNKVILSDTTDDNNSSAIDFANAIVTESIVAQLSGTTLAGGGFGGPSYGPVSYITLASPDLNPPGVNCWAVGRGMPRKFDEAATAVLTIG